ncbi:BEN domain-containing protein 2 [Sorex fumeus]|uniref:BEN domain-containing protein 2 n=1 Tax=Sorex fumeus TaxID=62283 RepID=UPI0024AD8403|nr:BEN domain-containing protein 2 [Sorex fumeus]
MPVPVSCDYIIVTIEDSDVDTTDDEDEDIIIVEESEEDSVSEVDDFMAVQPASQEFERYEVIGNQLVPIRDTTFKARTYTILEEGAYIPLQKRRRLSNSGENTQHLGEMIENTNRQVYQLCGLVSNMQRILETPLQSNENGYFLIPVDIRNRSDSGSTVRASILLDRLILMENSEIPRIISTRSLAQQLGSDASEVTPRTMNCGTLLVNRSEQPSSSGGVPSNCVEKFILVEMPEISESTLEERLKTINSSTLVGNDGGESSSGGIPPNFDAEKLILIEVPGNRESGLENNSEKTYYPALLGNINNPRADTSSISIPPNCALEKVILVDEQTNVESSVQESSQPPSQPTASSTPQPTCYISVMPNLEVVVKTENGVQKNTQVVNCPFFLENRSGQDISCFFLPANFELKPETSQSTLRKTNVAGAAEANSESLVSTESAEIIKIEDDENLPGTSKQPTTPGDDNDQGSAVTSYITTSFLAYLGDPKRNVRILSHHLAIAQQKSSPEHAICYLVGIVFSKEIMAYSSSETKYNQPLDSNKVAAIREYVATVFPNYDLCEGGEHWKNCFSDIRSLMTCICSEAKALTDPADNSQDLTTLLSAAMSERDDPGESSSQMFQPAPASQRKRKIPQYTAVVIGETSGNSNGSTVTLSEVFGYFGNPCRNILMSIEVMTVAKNKPRPELSARYLIRRLFSEEVLIRSNVYGHVTLGINPLNANKIGALREFLQEAFPYRDLSESGSDWKSCVTAINSCIRSLRHDCRKGKIKLTTETMPIEEARDSDSSDESS